MDHSVIYLTSIIVYLLGLGGIAVFMAFRVKNREDFAVAGRTLSPWVMVLTMLACWIGTGSIVGNAGKTYEVGMAALFLPFGAFIGMILLAFIARRTRDLPASSVPEIIGDRFGPIARNLAVTALVIAYLVIVSYQFNAGGAVIQAITSVPAEVTEQDDAAEQDGAAEQDDATEQEGATGDEAEAGAPQSRTIISDRTATLIAAIAIISFASLAGLMSLAYQDVITGLIITGTMIAACVIYWFKAGGWSGMEASFANMEGHEQHMQMFGVLSPVDLINFLMPAMLLVLGDANQYQRIFASRNSRGAGTAVTVLIFVALLVELLIIATAWIASSMMDDAEQGRYVLIYAARNFLPLPLGCLFMVTVVGIIVSTANSFLLVPATTFTKDVWYRFFPEKKGAENAEEKAVWVNRFMVIAFGVVAYGVSLLFAESETVFEKALYAFTIYGASITPTLLAAILWPRATKAGAITSIASGAVISLLWSEMGDLREKLPGGLADLDAVLPATVVSVGSLIIISLLTSNGTPSPKDEGE